MMVQGIVWGGRREGAKPAPASHPAVICPVAATPVLKLHGTARFSNQNQTHTHSTVAE